MLSLIIVYYNQPQVLSEFLDSLSKNKDHDFTLFIADLSRNLYLERKLPFPVVVLKGANKGYSHGVNLCLRQALRRDFDQFCVLNYDIFFSSDFIKRLKKRFETADAFGGKIYYAKNYEYHQDRYTSKQQGKVLWYGGGEIDWKHAIVKHLGVDEVDQGRYDRLTETGFIPGTLFAFTKKVVRMVGFWDEHFFLYYEDVDYSVRVRTHGFKLLYDPSVVIWHKNAGVTGGSGSKLHQTEQRKSRLWFGLKHAPWRTKLHLLINLIHAF